MEREVFVQPELLDCSTFVMLAEHLVVVGIAK